MNTKVEILEPPELDHDKMMKRRFGRTVHTLGKLERRIVWNLFAHLAKHDFLPVAVVDDEKRPAPTAKEAMELIFNLDEARVIIKGGKGRHTILLVMGNNGTDIIADWNYWSSDADGFNAVMDAFDPEAFA